MQSMKQIKEAVINLEEKDLVNRVEMLEKDLRALEQLVDILRQTIEEQ